MYRWPGHTPRVSDSESAFLTSSQWMLLLPVEGPGSESLYSRVTQAPQLGHTQKSTEKASVFPYLPPSFPEIRKRVDFGVASHVADE